jgi:signal transduction histidine kinase
VRRRTQLLVVPAGVLIAAAVAVWGDVPLHDLVVLVALAFGAALLVWALASALLWVIPGGAAGRAMSVRTVTVALVPVVSVAAGALAASTAMFVSTHDLVALVVIVIGAGTAGVLAALALAAQLRAAQTEMAVAEQRREAIEQSRRDLVAGVSHDLRTPLAGIRAMAEALDDGVVTDDATIRRYYRSLTEGADHLARMVDDLFELSQVDSGTLHLDLDRVAVGDIASDAVAAAAVIGQAKQVDVLCTADERAAVEASTPALLRVLGNLLDNAVRHTPEGGTVAVDVVVVRGEVLVSVHDRCGGIPEAELERVFDRAYRGDAARSPGAEAGAGLGLAIARGLVEAHGGSLSVANEDGGCCFTVSLRSAPPLARETVHHHEVSPSRRPASLRRS